jgi:threonyl-tRNA synthetase
VINITDSQAEYANLVTQSLQNRGFRVNSDLRNEKIGFKIRGHSMQRVPYLLVVGDKEIQNGTVAVRTRDGEDLGSMTIEEVISLFERDTEKRSRQD